MHLDFNQLVTEKLTLGALIACTAHMLQQRGENLYDVVWREATITDDEDGALISYGTGLIRGIAFIAKLEPIELVEQAVAWFNTNTKRHPISILKPEVS